jgi:hypothetical protein
MYSFEHKQRQDNRDLQSATPPGEAGPESWGPKPRCTFPAVPGEPEAAEAYDIAGDAEAEVKEEGAVGARSLPGLPGSEFAGEERKEGACGGVTCPGACGECTYEGEN